MGETKTKYVCRMLGDGVLPRKHVRLGDVVKVPKRTLMIETPDHERGIPRQDNTQEESALPQGRGLGPGGEAHRLETRSKSVFKKSYAWTCYRWCDDH